LKARRIALSGGVLTLLSILIATEVLAQFPGGGMGGSRGGRSGGGRESGRGTIQAPRLSNSGDAAELLEFRLGMLEEGLKMSPAQLRLWEPYAERMRAAVADLTREHAPTQAIGTPNALQQMNRSVDQARNRLTALEDVAVAAKAFYEILSPEQKMLLDARSPSILPLLSGGSTQAPPPEASGRRPPRDDGAFTPPSRQQP
jgi:hypothetical protein